VAWEALTDEEKGPYQSLSDEHWALRPRVKDFIVNRLKTVYGEITFDELTRNLNTWSAEQTEGRVTEWCSQWSVESWFWSEEGSAMVSTRLRPRLTQVHVRDRVVWCDAFMKFWDGAKTTKRVFSRFFVHIRYLKIDIDEKWFWGLVPRNNIKTIPHLGVLPLSYALEHKCHIPKILFLAATAYLPENKDGNHYASGGRAFKLCFDRACIEKVQMGKPARERVYLENEDGSPVLTEKGNRRYTYTGQIVRNVGDKYKIDCEITGSKTEAKDKSTGKMVPKFSYMVSVTHLSHSRAHWRRGPGSHEAPHSV
jgi:hypothetical protein